MNTVGKDYAYERDEKHEERDGCDHREKRGLRGIQRYVIAVDLFGEHFYRSRYAAKRYHFRLFPLQNRASFRRTV